MEPRAYTKDDIPRHWKFPERSDPKLNVVFINRDIGYLSFSTGFTETDDYSGPSDSVDYSFDPRGNHKAVRRMFQPTTESRVIQIDFMGELPMKLWMPLTEGQDTKISIRPSAMKGFQPPLAEMRYSPQGDLRMIRSGEIFCSHPLSGLVTAPVLELNTDGKAKVEDFQLNVRGNNQKGYVLSQRPSTVPNEFGFVVASPKSDLPIYNVTWKSPEEFDQVTFFLNRDDKVTKMMTAPLNMGQELLGKALTGIILTDSGYVIPWTDLDRELGISLGYIGNLQSLRLENGDQTTNDINHK